MRHIIVHLIRGEAKDTHEAITQDLAGKFDSFPIHNRIVPHLTLKRWFEIDEIGMEKVRNVLDNFAATHMQSPYHLGGFGHFNDDVIYVDVKPSIEMSVAICDLMAALHSIEEMAFDEFDDVVEDYLHATVAMGALKPFNYEQLWSYLQGTEGMSFDMRFDNVAILKRETEKWVVDQVWELPSV